MNKEGNVKKKKNYTNSRVFLEDFSELTSYEFCLRLLSANQLRISFLHAKFVQKSCVIVKYVFFAVTIILYYLFTKKCYYILGLNIIFIAVSLRFFCSSPCIFFLLRIHPLCSNLFYFSS
jgi:hypothetical protein